MDKLADSYKAVVALFHGIIAAWIFSVFTEQKMSEFDFVILVIFFGIANVIVWGALVTPFQRLRKKATSNASSEVGRTHYTVLDTVALTTIAIGLGLMAAYVDKHRYVQSLGDKIANWDWGGATRSL